MTKRYEAYKAYPQGSDQRNILRVCSLYVAALRRTPDRDGLGFWMAGLGTNEANLAGVTQGIIGAGYPALFGTTGITEDRRNALRGISAYIMDDGYQWGNLITDSLLSKSNDALAVDLAELIFGYLAPSRPRFENRTSLAIILGWEESNQTSDSAAMEYVTTDYQTVLDYAATH